MGKVVDCFITRKVILNKIIPEIYSNYYSEIIDGSSRIERPLVKNLYVIINGQTVPLLTQQTAENIEVL